MNLYVDENLPPRLADMLQALGFEARSCRDDGNMGRKDVDWLGELNADDVVITSDVRIGRRLTERRAWQRAGCTVVHVPQALARFPDRLASLLCLGRVELAAAHAESGPCWLKIRPFKAQRKSFDAVRVR